MAALRLAAALLLLAAAAAAVTATPASDAADAYRAAQAHLLARDEWKPAMEVYKEQSLKAQSWGQSGDAVQAAGAVCAELATLKGPLVQSKAAVPAHRADEHTYIDAAVAALTTGETACTAAVQAVTAAPGAVVTEHTKLVADWGSAVVAANTAKGLCTSGFAGNNGDAQRLDQCRQKLAAAQAAATTAKQVRAALDAALAVPGAMPGMAVPAPAAAVASAKAEFERLRKERAKARKAVILGEALTAAMFTAVAPCQTTQAAMHAFGVHSPLRQDLGDGPNEYFNKLALRFTSKATDRNKNGIRPWKGAMATKLIKDGAFDRVVVGNRDAAKKADLSECVTHAGRDNRERATSAAGQWDRVMAKIRGEGDKDENLSVVAKSQKCKDAVRAIGTAAYTACKAELQAAAGAMKASASPVLADGGDNYNLGGSKESCAMACAMALLDSAAEGGPSKIKSCSVVAYENAAGTLQGAALAISGFVGDAYKPTFVPAEEWAAHTPAKLTRKDGTVVKDDRQAFVTNVATMTAHRAGYRAKVDAAGGKNAKNTFGEPASGSPGLFPPDHQQGACSEDKLLYMLADQQQTRMTSNRFKYLL